MIANYKNKISDIVHFPSLQFCFCGCKIHVMEKISQKWLKPISGPLLLCIVDGFGLREEKAGNAVALANTPTLDELYQTCPHAQLWTHGEYVGLPEGQMGNSEVGHMTIGAGRTILQKLDEIRQGMDDVDVSQLAQSVDGSGHVHLIGLLSDGGIHSHTDHFVLMCQKLSALGKPIYVHAILDGRDTAPQDALKQVQDFQQQVSGLDVHVVDLIGRFYAMDRDGNGDRLQKAYDLYTRRIGTKFANIDQAVQNQYNKDLTDEFFEPCLLEGFENCQIQTGDAVVFMNFRADRMRQIVRSFIGLPVPMLQPQQNVLPQVWCMAEYDKAFEGQVSVLFPPSQPKMTLGEVVADSGGKQLRIAESEKYAHVTFFLNGGREKPFEGEDRIVVPSPKVKTYDLQPEMSLPEVTEKLTDAISSGGYDLIVLNIANGDQVGHSGSLEASVTAVEHIDKCLAKLVKQLKSVGGEMLMIADHGNCEEMFANDGSMMTSHTLNPVPILYVGRQGASVESGSLRDVAPTALSLLGLDIPKQMTGEVLVKMRKVL